jgi:flagella basal body P-ring formation protein FlgA
MNTVKQSNQIKHYMLFSILLLCVSAIGAVLLAKTVNANTLNTHEEIENKIHSYIKAQLLSSPQSKTEIIISPIDRRKRFIDCNKQLILTIAGKNGLKRNNTISVSCPTQWRIFVPVTIKTLMPIVVATKNLSVGDLLTSTNTSIEYLDTSLIIGQTTSELSTIIGSKVKRYVQHGRPVLSYFVCMVCKNEQVSIVARKASLQIKSAGVALSDGSLGQKISIKNNSSGRIIEATVVAVGRAEINL